MGKKNTMQEEFLWDRTLELSLNVDATLNLIKAKQTMLEVLMEEYIYNEGSTMGQKTNIGFENWGWWLYPLCLILLGDCEEVAVSYKILTSLLCPVVAIKIALPTTEAEEQRR